MSKILHLLEIYGTTTGLIIMFFFSVLPSCPEQLSFFSIFLGQSIKKLKKIFGEKNLRKLFSSFLYGLFLNVEQKSTVFCSSPEKIFSVMTVKKKRTVKNVLGQKKPVFIILANQL